MKSMMIDLCGHSISISYLPSMLAAQALQTAVKLLVSDWSRLATESLKIAGIKSLVNIQKRQNLCKPVSTTIQLLRKVQDDTVEMPVGEQSAPKVTVQSKQEGISKTSLAKFEKLTKGIEFYPRF